MAGDGIFAETYTNTDAGADIAADLFDQGCDIIFPVAGATGLGAAQVAQEQGLTVIGVDADQTQTEPDLADVYLTSVMKRIDVTVFEAIKLLHEGASPSGENFIGTLENGGVGLAPFHSYEDTVPQELKDDLAEIEQGLTDGSISTGWPIYRTPVVRHLTPDMLANLTYPSGYTADGAAPLTDGAYEEAAAPGSATKTQIQLLSDLTAFGDLDADGVDDAAVVLVTDPGGSGTFYDLVAVLDRNGNAFPVATAYLGDRTTLNSVTIEDGRIMVDMLTRGPDAPMSADPTQPETRTYQIQVSLEQVPEPVMATEVVKYVPDVPSETQEGSCFTNAIGLGREDAYRCTVGNQIYDPCFVVDDAPTVVCGANPSTGEAGFVLELTEPLPAPESGNLSMPWLVELADGQVCGLMTGTVPGIGDRIAPYGCPDGTYLFEDFQQDDVWMAEKATINLGEDGFFLVDSEMVPIRTVWQ